jgi:NAD(P)-dependent dehydrogenase (short-subunit alcohol dehydrogenase family)
MAERGVALVTGGARGIGLEVCRRLAGEGMTVVLSARDRGRAQEAAAALAAGGSDVRPLELDVADPASVRDATAALRADPGRLDVLVNNAAAFAPWDETASGADLDAVRDLLEVNLLGAWRVTQAVLPLLRASPSPRIVNVSSGAGSRGDPDSGLGVDGGAAASYGVSKAALNALTTQLAAELADTPILVNAVCPGLTATAPGMEEMGARPVEEGAESVAWAALLPDDGPSGGFYRDARILPW